MLVFLTASIPFSRKSVTKAQLDRVLPVEGRGQRFEASRVRQINQGLKCLQGSGRLCHVQKFNRRGERTMKNLATTLCLTVTALLIGVGCSSQVISSSDRTIIVRPGFPDKGIENAMGLAKKECLKEGKLARVPSFTSFNTDIYVFKCVKR